MTQPATIDDVLSLYDQFGDQTYGEDVTQTAHALQCAALAMREQAAEALVAAALLHDIGHLVHLDESGRDADSDQVDDEHEAIGARVLAPIFGPDVAGPIALHVTAKRYRCAVEPSYLAGLSPASVRSLALQGGPLTPNGCATFTAHPTADASIQLRGWDDAGKVDGLDVVTMTDYRDLLQRLTR